MKKLSSTILIIAFFTALVFSQDFAQKTGDSKFNAYSELPIKYTSIVNSNSDPTFRKIPDYNGNYRIDNATIGKNTVESQLSTLWVVVTLNMITADVLSLYIPEGMDDWTEYAKGKESEIMLGAAIMYQVPISMVFLSKVLPYKANRWANIIAAGMMSVAVVVGGETDPHYIVCAAAEVGCMSLIAWKAIKWKNPEAKNHNLGLNLNPQRKTYGLKYSYTF